ncbi:hypothetical protein JCM11251_005369 [Rhodosporidiobolus azoricus]
MAAGKYDQALGHASAPFDVQWNQRDLLLYAVGIGAKKDELQFTFEDHKDWHPFPTYPLVLALKANHTSIANFANARAEPTPGLPQFSPTKVVHYSQTVHVLGELPSESGKGWTMKKVCVGVTDTGKGLIVDEALELINPSKQVVVRMISSSYNFGDFGTKGYAKSVAPKQPVKAGKPPQRPADFVMSEKISEEQALVYRLSGDYNPLHIDPVVGKGMNFPGVILHGLCSYGHAARTIVLNAGKGNGRSLEYMSARFTSPVIPGDELETSLWLSKDEQSGGTRVDFVQKNVKSGKLTLGGGVALLKADKQSKL